ncbi:ABC transporter permease [bacterium]|nr:ABC transporter permease [bacterium]
MSVRPGYFVGRAFANMRAERTATTLTLLVVTISFLIFGAYMMLGFNVQGFVDHFAGEIQIVYYLREGVPAADGRRLAAEIEREANVRKARYISERESLDRLRRELIDAPELLDGLTASPIPASIEVTLAAAARDKAGYDDLVRRYETRPIVESVDAGDEFTDAFARVVAGMWAGGIVIALFLMLSAIFIVANTIRLTIIRRRDEIDNMRLVGATNTFVKTPFLIEGILVGALGAILAGATLWALHFAIVMPWTVTTSVLTVLTRFEPRFLPAEFLAAGLGLGAFVGLVGAQLSVGRYLKS